MGACNCVPEYDKDSPWIEPINTNEVRNIIDITRIIYKKYL